MNKEDALKLIYLYGKNRSLWDPTHADYTNNLVKEDTWTNISQEMNMSLYYIKRQMVTFRKLYNKEKIQVKASRLRGQTPFYKPAWYAYEAFSFMEEKYYPKDLLVIKDDDDSDDDKPCIVFASKAKKLKNGGDKTEGAPSKCLREKPDEYESWARSCAADLKNMDPLQQIFAKNAVAAILMEGQLGLLEKHSVKINSYETHCENCNCRAQYLPKIEGVSSTP